MKFFRKYLIIAQCKALDERISEWTYFLNFDKQFQRYPHFSAPKKGGFVTRVRGELHSRDGTENIIFYVFFVVFWV